MHEHSLFPGGNRSTEKDHLEEIMKCSAQKLPLAVAAST